MTQQAPLTEINGIGPATAQALKTAGIATIGELSNAAIEEIAAVPGFGYIRAQQVRKMARDCLDEGGDEGSDEEGVSVAGADSGKGGKSKKGGGKKKKGKKNKDKKKDKKKDKDKKKSKGKKK